MRFWWVNQKQTYRHEIPGGYMWSPNEIATAPSSRLWNYAHCDARDCVFSYADGRIKAVGQLVHRMAVSEALYFVVPALRSPFLRLGCGFFADSGILSARKRWSF